MFKIDARAQRSSAILVGHLCKPTPSFQGYSVHAWVHGLDPLNAGITFILNGTWILGVPVCEPNTILCDEVLSTELIM